MHIVHVATYISLSAFIHMTYNMLPYLLVSLAICIELHYKLGIRIRSEGLAQVMKKRNASEYIIGSIQRYPRASVAI